MFYAYIYRHPGTLEPFYVGKGKGDRAESHLKKAKNTHLRRRIAKMLSEGLHPLIEKICAINEDHALFLEVCLISVLGRQDLNRGPLLNHTDGGDGLKNASPETRAKMAAAKLGKKRAPFSEEWKQEMSRVQMNKTPTLETCLKISSKCGRPKGFKLSAKEITRRTATRTERRLNGTSIPRRAKYREAYSSNQLAAVNSSV